MFPRHRRQESKHKKQTKWQAGRAVIRVAVMTLILVGAVGVLATGQIGTQEEHPNAFLSELKKLNLERSRPEQFAVTKDVRNSHVIPEGRKNDWAPVVGITTPSEEACSGVILDERWVLTAGHCCWNKATGRKHISLLLKVSVDTQINQRNLRRVARAFMHPKFKSNCNGNMFEYDLCLLHMSSRITACDRAIDPPVTIAKVKPPPNAIAYIVGYGATSVSVGGQANGFGTLRLGFGLVTDCNSVNVNCANWQSQKSKEICVGTGGQYRAGTCPGDSGGGLWSAKHYKHQNGVNKWRLYGIVSMGECKDGGYSFYTSLHRYDVRSWIQTVTGIQRFT